MTTSCDPGVPCQSVAVERNPDLEPGTGTRPVHERQGAAVVAGDGGDNCQAESRSPSGLTALLLASVPLAKSLEDQLPVSFIDAAAAVINPKP